MLGQDPNATAIVSAVLGMAHALGMRVNAEGVEHEDQAHLLSEEGCEEVQGFLFSRPVPADEFRHLLAMDVKLPRVGADAAV
jgi:EAL domain-containing protein (putative c-di-GMP-specific phosphodiesterase class I)